MTQDRFSATGKNFGGQVEEGFGRVTDKTEVEGKMKQQVPRRTYTSVDGEPAAADALLSLACCRSITCAAGSRHLSTQAAL